MWLSVGRKSFRIGLAVLIQYRSVTPSQPASHVAVAITLNAKASSLKILQFLGNFVLRPPTGAPPLDPAGGLPSPRSPVVPPIANLLPPPARIPKSLICKPLGWDTAETWSEFQTRSSADADNRLDAFSGQSRSKTWYHSTCYI